MASCSDRGVALGWALGPWLWLGWAGPAWAGNASQPRVPATFADAQCMRRVEPGESVTLPLTVPLEDTTRTADEPTDSRTLRFFATCRDADVAEMPPWIDVDDVAAVRALDPSVPAPEPSQVLSLAPAWRAPGHDGRDGSCVRAIDDAPRPITCEATAPGLEWDTTDAAPGGWVVWGYTYEPVDSLWTRRPGVVWIEGEGAPPVVALTYPYAQAEVTLDAGIEVRACAAGAPGTTVALQWATATSLVSVSPQWTTWDERVVDEAGEVAAAWWPDPQLTYAAVFVRAVATDPAHRRFETAPRGPIVVVPGDAEPLGGRPPWADGCEDRATPWPAGRGAAFAEDPSPDADPGPAPDPVSRGSAAAGDDAAVGCRTAPGSRGTPIWWVWGLWGLVRRGHT